MAELIREPAAIERTAPRLIGSRDVPATLGALRSKAIDAVDGSRLVAIQYRQLPSADVLIDRVLEALAEVALEIWPDWYDGLGDGSADGPDPGDRLAEAIASNRRFRREPTAAWFRVARRSCQTGKPPLLGVKGPRLAAELGMAITPVRLQIALAVVDESQPPGRLLGLSRASEWLADATGAEVVVLVSRSKVADPELDGINSNAEIEPDPFGIDREPAIVGDPVSLRPDPRAIVDVTPFLGRPHPKSQGEQILAKFLESDTELRGLFSYNTRVAGRDGASHVADLVWPEGRLVVEVDGYYHHSDRASFSRDRRRDYELLTQGYATLRLPHDEVLEDVELAASKIRDLVRLRSEISAPPESCHP